MNYCYVVQFPGLAKITSHKKKKELIDNEIIIVHASVCEKYKKYSNAIFKKIIVKFILLKH